MSVVLEKSRCRVPVPHSVSRSPKAPPWKDRQRCCLPCSCCRGVEGAAQRHVGQLFQVCGRCGKGRIGDVAWNGNIRAVLERGGLSDGSGEVSTQCVLETGQVFWLSTKECHLKIASLSPWLLLGFFAWVKRVRLSCWGSLCRMSWGVFFSCFPEIRIRVHRDDMKLFRKGISMDLPERTRKLYGLPKAEIR